MTPLQAYQAALNSQRLEPCPDQASVMETFERLYTSLVHQSLWDKCVFEIRRLLHKAQPIQGVYLWGSVGRGKTELMDMFYESLPFKAKKRLHFHRLMATIHELLATLKGHASPLDVVVAQLTQGVRVICVDEFLVTDIADAMILSGTLKALFARGVTLVTTSNTKPELLYANGLQRDAFLPAIAMIQEHCRTIALLGGLDFRLRYLQQQSLYLVAGADANRALEQTFARLTPEAPQVRTSLDVLHRSIPVKQMADGIIWFEFNALCNTPRSTADYCEIARLFHTIFITDIPCMTEHQEEACRRLIHAIDAFYDRRTKLLVSAAAQPADLYTGTRLKGMMERTASRLMEMSTQPYLEQEHKP